MLNAIKKEVDAIRLEMFNRENKEDLEFDVILLIAPNDSDGDAEMRITLSINHHGQKLSRVIFPKSSHFQLLDLEEEMGYLYNATV